MSTARSASEVKRITLLGGNICTNGREERKKEGRDREKGEAKREVDSR